MFLRRLKREWREFRILLKNIPALVTVLFVMSIFSMNLLANKSIQTPWWLGLDLSTSSSVSSSFWEASSPACGEKAL